MAKFAKILNTYGFLGISIALIAVFGVLNEHFITLDNLRSIAEQNASLALVSVGMTFCIISGNMDLSPGGAIALSSIVCGLVFEWTGNVYLAFAAAVAAAILVGLVNGGFIAWLDINPVIVTLAAMLWTRGLALAFTKAESLVVFDPVVMFVNIESFHGISVPLIVMALAFVLGWFVLTKTRMGRYTAALGGNEYAARQAGIRTGRCKMLIFAFAGLLVGLASVMAVIRFSSAQPNVATNLELDAIVAVIIGGNLPAGGEGSVGKTLFGLIFICILSAGLNSLGITDDVYLLIKGSIILLALALQSGSSRMMSESE